MNSNELKEFKKWAIDNSGKILLCLGVILVTCLLIKAMPDSESMQEFLEHAEERYIEWENTKVEMWKKKYCIGLTEEDCSKLIYEFRKEQFKDDMFGHPMTANEYIFVK